MCGCEVAYEHKETIRIPASEEVIKQLKMGEDIEVTIKGRLVEASLEYGSDMRVEVSEIKASQADKTFEDLIDDGE